MVQVLCVIDRLCALGKRLQWTPFHHHISQIITMWWNVIVATEGLFISLDCVRRKGFFEKSLPTTTNGFAGLSYKRRSPRIFLSILDPNELRFTSEVSWFCLFSIYFWCASQSMTINVVICWHLLYLIRFKYLLVPLNDFSINNFKLSLCRFKAIFWLNIQIFWLSM